ncbi:nuclear factor interleukin-3-regulated protein-like isoform X1 [Amblyomma americanum]|uniref:BZIP domain-containing protein n=1 Tax=Amblyomma americanum TaxID=6943 RepID=A0AAQ4D9L1_AMBAM
MGPVHILEQPHLIWGREMPLGRTPLCQAADSDISDDSPVAALDMSLAASRPSPSPPLSQSPTPSSSLLLATGAAALGAAGLGAAPPKKSPQPIPAECKDEAYWERRKRNNESAKRSRELRRIKEQQTALRVLYLEQENLQLRTELTMLRSEVDKLRQLLFVGKHPS